jgi:hypothetical protein
MSGATDAWIMAMVTTLRGLSEDIEADRVSVASSSSAIVAALRSLIEGTFDGHNGAEVDDALIAPQLEWVIGWYFRAGVRGDHAEQQAADQLRLQIKALAVEYCGLRDDDRHQG